MSLLKLSPCFVYKVWGGEKLAKIKDVPARKGADLLGETWEVSCHPSGPSLTGDGTSLSEKYSIEELPYLVKFIDTSDNLSVQVHPDNEYASRVENELGKSECWIILDTAPGSGIYLGLKEGVDKARLQKSIEENENVNELLNFYEVKRGDFFFIPAGTIHAIGEGVTLAEVQQCSGVTYRVWDWNRVDDQGNSRELHVDKALDVINFEEKKNRKEYFFYQKLDDLSDQESILISQPDFRVLSVELESKREFDLYNERPRSVLCLENSCVVTLNNEREEVHPFEAVLLEGKEGLTLEPLEPKEGVSKVLLIY